MTVAMLRSYNSKAQSLISDVDSSRRQVLVCNRQPSSAGHINFHVES